MKPKVDVPTIDKKDYKLKLFKEIHHTIESGVLTRIHTLLEAENFEWANTATLLNTDAVSISNG